MNIFFKDIFSYSHLSPHPRDIELLAWCPARSVLLPWGEGTTLVLVGHPSNDNVTIKILNGVDVLLHRPTSHPIISYWGG